MMITIKDNIHERESDSVALPSASVAYRIGCRLREARTARHITLRQMEQETGVKFSHIARIERGEMNATIEMIEKLANFFNLELTLK